MVKGKRELSPREKHAVYEIIIGLVVVIAILVYLAFSTPFGNTVSYPLPPYNGKYSGALRSVVSEALKNSSGRINSTLRYLFSTYYSRLYNTAIYVNKMITVRKNSSISFDIWVTRNESIIISTRGNGTYGYALFLTNIGIKLKDSDTLGNTTRIFDIELPETYFGDYLAYTSISVVFTTNSSRPVSVVLNITKKLPESLLFIVKRSGVVFYTMLINYWINSNYHIVDEPLSSIIEHTRNVITLLSLKNGPTISSLEACILFKKFMDTVGVETHIMAVDPDGGWPSRSLQSGFETYASKRACRNLLYEAT
jgi:hypothetical protein